jgi:AcrR family transcriptional regulator
VGRPREHDAETRKLLFQAAETLLSRGGAEALSVRGVAHAAGTTTRAVYSTFGSKQGLYAALYRESWQALCRAIDALPPIEDPLEALVEAGASGFRSYALEHPNLFRLVFERLVPDIRPGPEDLAASEAALARLSECVQRCADAGLLSDRPVIEVALQFHAACQGLASTELLGWLTELGDPVELWRRMLRALVRGMAHAP